MVMNGEYIRILKEEVVTYFNLISWNSSKDNEKRYDNSWSGNMNWITSKYRSRALLLHQPA
jgi:hypothetical protein